MPITPFLRGQAFDPELIEAMSLAFENACSSLGLSVGVDPMTQSIAHQVIALAQRGIRRPTELYLLTVQEFKSR
jgi:hypothetical protein